jgi:CubicO group peptidase (beta-lactamase class C family)
MVRSKLILQIICATICLEQSTAQVSQQDEDVFPDSTWQYVQSPETQGWCIQKLIALERFIIDSSHATGVMVIQGGKVLYDFGDTKELCFIASCRKSVLSILYGPFVECGTINLDKTLGDLQITDHDTLLDVEKRATISDLLTARSCVFLPSTESGTNHHAPPRGSRLPGSFFLYDNWGFNVAGLIFERETGRNIYDAVGEILAKPLKMQDWDRSRQHKEVFGDYLYSRFPEYHMWLSTRDMARIGYLMLRKGRWDGKQLIPQEWIEKTTSLVTSVGEMKQSDPVIRSRPWWKWGYGYMWRVWDPNENIRQELKGAYTATGSWGDYITVIPSIDLVLAMTTKSAYRRSTTNETYLKMIDLLLDARTDDSAENTILSARGMKTIGHIVSIARRESHIDFVKYGFTYQGREYFGWSSLSKDILASGEYAVIFDPSNPEVSRIDLTKKIEE